MARWSGKTGKKEMEREKREGRRKGGMDRLKIGWKYSKRGREMDTWRDSWRSRWKGWGDIWEGGMDG